MREIRIEELKEILESHRKWLNNEDGERANLWGANLRDANLWGANGNMKEIKSLKIETYPIAYTNTVMQIGCERHDIKDWFEFDDKHILAMDGKKARAFWKKWKPILIQIMGYKND